MIRMPIRLPPLAEQHRIVAEVEKQLTRLDAAVAALERARANLKRYRASVLKAAVEGRLVARETTKAGSESPFPPRKLWSIPEQESLTPLPEGWHWVRVRDVGRVQLGRQRSPKNHIGPSMRPYLRVANVYEDRLDLTDVMEMNFNQREFEAFRLREGDVLLNEGQSLELVGRPAIFRGEVDNACFQNTLVRFQASPEVLPEFALIVFRAYLRSGRFRRLARRTTNIAHLGAERLADCEFPLPPTAEQRRIVQDVEARLSIIDAVEVAAIQGLKRAERLRQSVLKRAF
jgi:type I restriction enzyme S subunit